jgi:toxin YhaV
MGLSMGWAVFAASNRLTRQRDPETWQTKNCTKRLAAVFKWVTEVIPADPTAPQFRQGKTLGPDHKHWSRAKFFQQYRLLFRFDTTSKVLVMAWVNDEKTLRAIGSKTDAYTTFEGMLEGGKPPDDFEALINKTSDFSDRLQTDITTTPGD